MIIDDNDDDELMKLSILLAKLNTAVIIHWICSRTQP